MSTVIQRFQTQEPTWKAMCSPAQLSRSCCNWLARVIFTSADYKPQQNPMPWWELERYKSHKEQNKRKRRHRLQLNRLNLSGAGDVGASGLCRGEALPVWEQEVMSALCPLLKITMVSAAKRPKLWEPCVVRERGDKFGAALSLLMLLVWRCWIS